MTIENDQEILENTEEMPPLVIGESKEHITNKRIEHLKIVVSQRLLKLESIKSDIPPKTYQVVLQKLKNEEQEISKQLAKEAEIKLKQEKITQALPKAYFEQRFLRIKDIRID